MRCFRFHYFTFIIHFGCSVYMSLCPGLCWWPVAASLLMEEILYPLIGRLSQVVQDFFNNIHGISLRAFFVGSLSWTLQTWRLTLMLAQFCTSQVLNLPPPFPMDHCTASIAALLLDLSFCLAVEGLLARNWYKLMHWMQPVLVNVEETKSLPCTPWGPHDT